MSEQITDTILMVRPIAFRRNEQTAEDNHYQASVADTDSDERQKCALDEFDRFVETLRSNDVNVITIDDQAEPSTPDSIFPNNWISMHNDGSIMLYPMLAPNRRAERRPEIVKYLQKNFKTSTVDSLAHYEDRNFFLEGTGSLILDRVNLIAYAAISERTHVELVEEFCRMKDLKPVIFHANQSVGTERLPIYHTNVMMCVGEGFASIHLDSIDDAQEKQSVIDSLQSSGKEIIELSEFQNNNFAGNMLQIKNREGKRFIMMSAKAFKSLEEWQKEKLSKHGEIIYSDITTIETLGGGSARCMMAEVFLPKMK